MSRAPGRRLEKALFEQGCRFVAGVDEVGRGAWAGPVSVGVAVVSPGAFRLPGGVRDSKLLSPLQREALFEPLSRKVAAYAVGHASPLECDELGMTAAQRLATARALTALAVEPDALIVDGVVDFTGHPGARCVIGADRTSVVVAAASVLAKVTRDRMMISFAADHPGYGFERHKGYVSREHKEAVARLGMSVLHRRRWTVAGFGEDAEAELAVGVPDGETERAEEFERL